MGRFNQLPDVYTDPVDNSPLVDGFIKFEVPGGGTDLTTFADEDLKIPNANPVPLSGAGVPPNIFFNGNARAILFNSAMEQKRVLDPVPGTGSATDAFASWSAFITYTNEDIVRGTDERYYISITAANIGNDPTVTSGFWMEIRFIDVWDTAYTFGIGFIALGSDNNLYVSRVSANVGNDPVSSPTEWRLLTETGSVVGPGSSTDNSVPRNDGTTGVLLQDSGVLIDDSDNMTGVATLASGTHTIAAGSDLALSEGKITIVNTATEEAFLLTTSLTTQNGMRVISTTVTSGGLIRAIQQTSVFTNTNTGLLSVDVQGGSSTGRAFHTKNNGSGDLITGENNGGVVLNVENDGDIFNTNGTYGTISDRKTKTNISAGVRSYIEDFLKLHYVNYQRKDDLKIETEGGRKAPRLLGLIADEVEPIFENLVKDNLDIKQVVTGKEPVLRTKQVQETINIPVMVGSRQKIKRGKKRVKEHFEYILENDKRVKRLIPTHEEDADVGVVLVELVFNEDGTPSIIEVLDLDENGEPQFDDIGADIIESQPIMIDGVQSITQSIKSSIIDGTINSIVTQELILELRKLQKRVDELESAAV